MVGGRAGNDQDVRSVEAKERRLEARRIAEGRTHPVDAGGKVLPDDPAGGIAGRLGPQAGMDQLFGQPVEIVHLGPVGIHVLVRRALGGA